MVLGHEEAYIVQEHSDSKNKYSEDDIIKMLEFLVDNIFVVFARKVFQQIVSIPMRTNYAPPLDGIFLYSYEAEFIQTLLSTDRKQLASQFNFIYRYIDDVLFINNPEFENDLGQMYPVELEIKDTTESPTSASYLDLLLSIGRDGQLHTSIYDKPDDFNIRSWVAIYQLRPPMASLSHSLYEMPGLATDMTILFWGRHDFQISFSNRDTLRNVIAWNRPWRSFWSIRGSYQTIRSSSLLNAYRHSVAWPNTMTTLHRSEFITIHDLFTELDLLPTYETFS